MEHLHGPRRIDRTAGASRARRADARIERRPARAPDQRLSDAAQRSAARRELVQSLQRGALEDHAFRTAARDRYCPHRSSRAMRLRPAPPRALACYVLAKPLTFLTLRHATYAHSIGITSSCA